MVKKVFIDTNVWLRFLLKDDKEQFFLSKKIIELAEKGEIRPYISAIVFLEIHYVLSKYYQLTTAKINEIIKHILETRNLVVIDKTDFRKAFTWYKRYKIKLSDCLIASSVPKRCRLLSWDKELKRLKMLDVVSPKSFVS